ncbi:MAG TPA: M15 family metallopeptidase [Ideonella sp.]|nr:M15 family metallopeptidase [Ideonella sp.]
MLALWVSLYFALTCVVAAIFLLPGFRRWVAERGSAIGKGVASRGRLAGETVQGGTRRGLEQAGQLARGSVRVARRRWPFWLGAVTLLLVPAAVVFSVRGWHSFAAFDDRLAGADKKVAALLEGEHLVPPLPLPPEVFATAEVESVRPQLVSADRRWDRMESDFQQRLLRVFRVMKEDHGYEMVLLEGYRSPERQTMLASLGPSVTNAGAWQSYHQYGLAADCAFMRDGKLVIKETDPWAMKGYELYGQVAEQMGLVWGGRWKLMDFGHVELRKQRLTPPVQDTK